MAGAAASTVSNRSSSSFRRLLRRVKDCWASLWSQRAFEYRRRNAIAHADVDMAVIVQQLVEADAAGVMFTADPVTGRRDCVVIEDTSQGTNIRRVNSEVCDPAAAEVVEDLVDEFQEEAEECAAAKKELAGAKTDAEVDRALMKVDILCKG